VDGDYDIVTFQVTSNPDNHPPVGLEEAEFTVIKDGDQITILVDGPDIEGELTGTCDEDGNFFATGSGEFFGFPTDFQMDGNISDGEMEAEIGVGDGGGLPDSNMNGLEEGIFADFTAERVD